MTAIALSIDDLPMFFDQLALTPAQFRGLMDQYGCHVALKQGLFEASGTGVAVDVLVLGKGYKVAELPPAPPELLPLHEGGVAVTKAEKRQITKQERDRAATLRDPGAILDDLKALRTKTL